MPVNANLKINNLRPIKHAAIKKKRADKPISAIAISERNRDPEATSVDQQYPNTTAGPKLVFFERIAVPMRIVVRKKKAPARCEQPKSNESSEGHPFKDASSDMTRIKTIKATVTLEGERKMENTPIATIRRVKKDKP